MFRGTMARSYEQNVGPILFEPYARELASRVGSTDRLLELACGSGRVTRHLLPMCSEVVATDLSPDMIEIAASVVPATYQLADASSLQFEDSSFDAIACGFGAMFFPNKPQAFHEARRTLKPGGKLHMTTWANPTKNPWALVIGKTFDTQIGDIPDSNPSPFAYCDRTLIEMDLTDSGFGDIEIDEVTLPLIVDSAEVYARATATGTPLAYRLVEAGVLDAEPFGDEPMKTEMTAVFIAATKPT